MFSQLHRVLPVYKEFKADFEARIWPKMRTNQKRIGTGYGNTKK